MSAKPSEAAHSSGAECTRPGRPVVPEPASFCAATCDTAERLSAVWELRAAWLRWAAQAGESAGMTIGVGPLPSPAILRRQAWTWSGCAARLRHIGGRVPWLIGFFTASLDQPVVGACYRQMAAELTVWWCAARAPAPDDLSGACEL